MNRKESAKPDKLFPSMTSFGLSACMHLLMGLVLALILIETEQDKPRRIIATSVSELDNQNQELESISSPPEQDNQEQTENVPNVQLPVVAMSQETSTLHVESTLQQQDTNSSDAKINSQNDCIGELRNIHASAKVLASQMD